MEPLPAGVRSPPPRKPPAPPITGGPGHHGGGPSGGLPRRVRIRLFLAEVVTELRKVTWPSPSGTTSNVAVVGLALAAVGGVLLLFDYGFVRTVSELIGVVGQPVSL